jgi:hypothetical protein
MPKLTDLKKSSQRTINKIARASKLSPEKVLRIMLKPSCGPKVTTHLNYGVNAIGQ